MAGGRPDSPILHERAIPDVTGRRRLEFDLHDRAVGREAAFPDAAVGNSIGNTLTVLWASFPVLILLTVFPQSLPQPGDLFMAAVAALVLTSGIVRPPAASNLYLAGCLFLTYVAAVNLTWWSLAQTADTMFVLSALFYIYNFMILVSCLALMKHAGDRLIAVMRVTLLISVVVELCATLFGVGTGNLRSTGTFANPNQLGYWTLLTMGCWLVVRGNRSFTLLDLGVIGALVHLSMLSLSKAALVGVAMQLIFAVSARGFRRSGVMFVACLLLASMSIGLVDLSRLQEWLGSMLEEGVVANVIDRFETLGSESDSSLAGRGYDRLWLFPQYLFFGAGEGAFDRFTATGLYMEIHSSWATLIFSYGVIGTLLFLSILWIIFRVAPLSHLIFFLPIATYGLTHQGLRDSLLWIFLGLVYGSARYSPPAAITRIPSSGRSGSVRLRRRFRHLAADSEKRVPSQGMPRVGKDQH